MFLLKKLIGNLLMPLPFSLLLLVLGLLLLWYSHANSRKQFWGKLLVSLGAGVLLLASLPYTAQKMTITMEREHPPMFAVPTGLEYIVVLGGGGSSDPFLPPRLQLSTASYYRLLEGLRLYQANPGATLLFSGYAGSKPISNALLYSMVAREYGVPAGRIQLFETAKDTAEEAALMAPIIKQHKAALVTSASHMPRALGLFRAQGAEPIAVPTLFLGRVRQNPPFLYERLPGAGSLGNVTVIWHEMVGSLWRKLKGIGRQFSNSADD